MQLIKKDSKNSLNIAQPKNLNCTITYRIPPPAGPNALKTDIAVMEMPLAAPL